MAIIGINAKAKRTYTLKEDTSDPRTVFHYTLPTLAMQHDLFSRVGDERARLKLVDDVLRQCLCGVENLQVTGGEGPIALEWSAGKDTVLAALTVAQRVEISDAIIAEMQGGKELEKN